MATPRRGRELQPEGSEPHERGRAGDIGEVVGDPDDARLEGRGRHGGRSDERPTWPPGPESDEWGPTLERWPELAPAVADPKNRNARDAGRGEGARGPAERDAAQPAVRGVAHGLPARMDRLRCLGNAVVPAQAELAFRVLHDRITR